MCGISAIFIAAVTPVGAAGPWPTPVTSPIDAQQTTMRLFATGTDRYDPGMIFGSSTRGTTTVLADAGRGGSLSNKAVVDVSTNNSGVCALDHSGGLHCWGNAKGFDRFGLGEDVDARSPVKIRIAVDGQAQPVSTIAVSDNETCVTASLKAICWGQPEDMHPVATSPSVVPGAPDVVSIDADAGKVCAIATDATVWCWGTNADELGVNKATGKVGPTQLGGSLTGRQAIAISVGEDVSCAVDTVGSLHCWGVGGLGVGTGQSDSVLKPVRVRGSLANEKVVGVSVGAIVYAVDARGRLHQWSGTATPVLSPNLGSMAGKRVLQVSADSRRDAPHVCAVVLGGDVYCRGFNAYGRLGIGGDPEMFGLTDAFTKMLAGSARGMKAVQAEVGAEFTFVVAARPLRAPLPKVVSGALTLRLDSLGTALGTGSVGAQKPASAEGTSVTMPIEGASSTHLSLGGALTLKSTDGSARVLSGGTLDLTTGAVSFVVQGVGWPYDGNRVAIFMATLRGKVTSTTKGKIATTKMRAAPVVMGDVKNFPGETHFPGDAFEPGASVGTFIGSWKVSRK
jgi:hypothetical protein